MHCKVIATFRQIAFLVVLIIIVLLEQNNDCMFNTD